MQRRRALACYETIVWLACGIHATAPDASAQNQPEECNELNTLRSSALRPTDDRIIDECLGAELSLLSAATGNPLVLDRARTDFAERLTRQYHRPDNSAEFKKKFAERLANRFLAEFKRGKQLPVPVARTLAKVLREVAIVDTREALLDGLTFPDQVVRYLCAASLASLQDQINADAVLAAATLKALTQAGENEVNGVVAAMIYRAASLPGHADQAIAAMLKVMDGRLNSLRAPGLGLDRAELPAIAFFGTLSLNNDQKIQVVRRLAPLLRIHTERFTAGTLPTNEQAAVLETISEIEALLQKLVAPQPKAPSISEKMLMGGQTASIEMKIELNQWIGTAEEDGILTQNPWAVPRGAP